MCGITGIVNFNGRVDGIVGHLKNMTDAIRHRGPDGEGYLLFNGLEVVSAYGKDTKESIYSIFLKKNTLD